MTHGTQENIGSSGPHLLANMEQEFTDEQKTYLQGFVSGSDAARANAGLSTFASILGTLGLPLAANGSATATPVQPPTATRVPVALEEPTPSGPDALQHLAQNRFLAEGKKLTPEEQTKRSKHPLDRWDELQQHADEGRFPKGTDIFAFKFHGLFYVAPAQDAFMCRLRFPGGIINAYQLRSVATIAETLAGGYADVTTRANFQLREIRPENILAVLSALQDAGIVNRGAGADNIRNITGSPTAGVDPQELIDTRVLSREMHHYILNHRELYGLPRKFNIAFDGGGAISALEDTNDIGFAAVRVGEAQAVPAGVYFRMQLGGITGHKDFARDAGVLLKPEQCIPVAAAVLRVFIDNGDRTDRKKARLKYVLDQWGIEKYVAQTQKHLSFPLVRFPLDACEPRMPIYKHGHIGFHAQRQEGLFYVGVALPVGRLQVDQLRGLTTIAERHGSGTIRLTVWQNLLIGDIPKENIPLVKAELEALGLHWSATNVRGALVACTGNVGCKFSSTDTKRHAGEIAEYLEGRITIDQPLNLHLTGCGHSCAQHYIGDIGFLGTTLERGDDMVEGYHIFVGGGYGADQEIGREVFRNITAEDAPLVTEKMLSTYLQHRQRPDESFSDWAKRYSTEQLATLFEQASVTTA